LRNTTQDRYAYRVGRFDLLIPSLEFELTNLLVKEINFMRRLETLKEDLIRRYDYTNYAAFRTIDRDNDGFIDSVNLKNFAKHHYVYLSDREVLTLIRRIDTDGDARIGYSEFSDFMKPAYPVARALDVSYELRARSMSENKRSSLMVSNFGSSPLRASNYTASRGYSPMKRTVQFDEVTPTKKTNLNDSRYGLSNQRTAEKSTYGSPLTKSTYKSPLVEEVENETIRALREQITLEKELENAKVRLAMQPDFNLYDAFKIFDTLGLGYVTLNDLKLGLSEIGVYATYDELDLFIKRYDNNKDGRLRFNEFTNAFLPLDPYPASLLNRRSSNYTRTTYPRDGCFMADTRFEFKSTWKTHFRVEN